MTTTAVKYEPKTRVVGILKRKKVTSVDMPRARFLELVDECLDRVPASKRRAMREELLPVAETMVRFPISEWIHEERGCGCVIGEYLVATKEIDRQELIKKVHGEIKPIVDLLEDNPLRRELADFGFNIDRAVRQEIYDGETDPYLRGHKLVDSVEIID